MTKPTKDIRVARPENTDNWKPNEVPLSLRIYCLVLSALLLAYGVSGLMRNKLVVATAKGGGGRLVFYDGPAWLLASAVVVGAALLLLVVVDHYDRRNNETWYVVLRRTLLYLGLALLAAAFVSYFYLASFG